MVAKDLSQRNPDPLSARDQAGERWCFRQCLTHEQADRHKHGAGEEWNTPAPGQKLRIGQEKEQQEKQPVR